MFTISMRQSPKLSALEIERRLLQAFDFVLEVDLEKQLGSVPALKSINTTVHNLPTDDIVAAGDGHSRGESRDS